MCGSEGVNLQAFKDQWSLDTSLINLSRLNPVGGLLFLLSVYIDVCVLPGCNKGIPIFLKFLLLHGLRDYTEKQKNICV